MEDLPGEMVRVSGLCSDHPGRLWKVCSCAADGNPTLWGIRGARRDFGGGQLLPKVNPQAPHSKWQRGRLVTARGQDPRETGSAQRKVGTLPAAVGLFSWWVLSAEVQKLAQDST